MSYKQVPITAKILKTTKGGVTQPILNMGAPVKMKASSPAKQTGSFGGEYQKRMSEKKEAAKQKRAEAGKNIYNKKLDQYKKDVTIADKSWDGKGKKNNIARDRAESFSKELFDFDNKNYPNRTKDFKTATDYAKSKINKRKKEESKTLTPKNDPPVNDPPVNDLTKNKKSYDQAYKNRDQKTYGKMDKATYIKEAKRQNASKKAGKGWDASGKGKTINISNNGSTSNTVEPTSKVTKKQEATQSAKNNIAANTKKKVNAKTEPKKEVKKTRSQKLRSKGEKALADGNKAKALRIRRRYDKQVAKETKKKGQAAGAIQPK